MLTETREVDWDTFYHMCNPDLKSCQKSADVDDIDDLLIQASAIVSRRPKPELYKGQLFLLASQFNMTTVELAVERLERKRTKLMLAEQQLVGSECIILMELKKIWAAETAMD